VLLLSVTEPYCFISQHLEAVIKSKIPGIQSLINKTIAELETELSRLGKPIAVDDGVIFLFKCSINLNDQFQNILYGLTLEGGLFFHSKACKKFIISANWFRIAMFIENHYRTSISGFLISHSIFEISND
jgi:hypothetical protein